MLDDHQSTGPSSILDVFDPATNEAIDSVAQSSRADVKVAIDRAEAALPGWRATTALERGAGDGGGNTSGWFTVSSFFTTPTPGR